MRLLKFRTFPDSSLSVLKLNLDGVRAFSSDRRLSRLWISNAVHILQRRSVRRGRVQWPIGFSR